MLCSLAMSVAASSVELKKLIVLGSLTAGCSMANISLHEAGRWVAACAYLGALPLASEGGF